MTPKELARWLQIADRHDRECGGYQACCEMSTGEATAAIRDLIAAIASEREACAKIVEDGYAGNRVETDFGDEIRKKATAIRART